MYVYVYTDIKRIVKREDMHALGLLQIFMSKDLSG